MNSGSAIVTVSAREIFTGRGHPGVEATVVTANGGRGVAVAVAGTSTGEHEVPFLYDGGSRFGGVGVRKAVDSVNGPVTEAIKGKDATSQREIDEILIELDGRPGASTIGGNTTSSVSGAVLKAGAASLGIPLYQHIGGLNACALPTPDVPALRGSTRYGSGQKSGGKPTFTFLCFGYTSYAEAAYAGWEATTALRRLLRERFNLTDIGAAVFNFTGIQEGLVEHDRELFDLMMEAITISGNEGKIGFQCDMAASTFWDREKSVFKGLLSREDKTKDQLISLYRELVNDYPIMILEDPLDENDYEGHAVLARELGINVMGDDLFTTNVERLQHGIDVGACNTLLLKVNQVGTISEAFDAVQLAFSHGYGVAPCASRGEGEAIADYGVGLNTGIMSGGGLGSIVNRFMEIEAELGSRARFPGRAGYKGFKNLGRE